jgi:HAD superfamily hydrolase (TIGR01490 family)
LSRKTAAFYDMDGTLIEGNVTNHYIYFAMTDPDFTSRARRLAELTLKAPYFWAMDRIDRRAFNEVFYASYEGISEDRLVIMGQELFDKVLTHKVYPDARKLIEGDLAVGREVVLLTGAIEAVAAPVAKALGIKTFMATKLEFAANNLATGKLIPPVMAGPEKAQFVRRWAEEHDIDLEQSVAYADDAADVPLLSSVGRPVAVNPDLRLATTARSHRWPVIHLSSRQSAATKAWNRARNTLDSARELAQKAIDVGEARWAERDDVIDRAKRLARGLTNLAGQARDAAQERLKNAAQEKKK